MTKPGPNAQTLFLQLLAGPSTNIIPGLLRVGVAQLAEELGWPLDATQAALDEIVEARLAEVDPRVRLIFVRRSLAENVPQSPNVIVSWRQYWSELPDCPLKRRVAGHFESVLGTVGDKGAFLAAFRDITGKRPLRKASRKAFAKPFGKASSKPLTNQDQDQDQDQERTDALRAFEAFFAEYPRQQNRGEARKVWIAKRLGPAQLPAIREAIQRQRSWPNWRDDGGRYIPYPAKWLKNEGWLDDFQAPRSADSSANWSLEACLHEPKCYNRFECHQKEMLAKGRPEPLEASA